jgi:hypothetical protein
LLPCKNENEVISRPFEKAGRFKLSGLSKKRCSTYSNAALEESPDPAGTFETIAALKAKFSGISSKY